MARNWENEFSQWARPPGKTEDERCENAIKAIRNAIKKSDKLKDRSLTVFPHGSYHNRVNVRQDSDVDVGVLCDESFFSYLPEGTTDETFGNSPAKYGYAQFKNELEEALIAHFGSDAIHRGNKAIDIRENSYHVEADVAPFFEYRHYNKDGTYRCGVALSPDNGGRRIHNYPKRLLDSWSDIPQHYENGVSKNKKTRRSYKGVVRILKKLRNEMDDAGIAAAKPIPGFLVECMVWNAPNTCFRGNTWYDKVKAVLINLFFSTEEDANDKDLKEVNNIKFLFHSNQPWEQHEANAFIAVACSYIKVI